MDDRANSNLAEDISAALDWWREAGVDGDLRDAPQQWIMPQVAEPEAEAEAPLAAPAPQKPSAPELPPPVDRSAWPQDFEDFPQWWLAEPWLDEGRTSGRVAPRGGRGAELMVLVAEPDVDDGDVLLSGPQGRLLSAMLAAFGIPEEQAYVASLLPRHTPHADWALLAARGMGELARHHIALAAPKRLIVFGTSILPLLGHDPAKNPGIFAEFQPEGAMLPLLAARDLAVLLERPRWKAGLWQSWLDWTETR